MSLSRFGSQVLYLLDNVLILALGLEVDAETRYGSDDAAYAA